MNQSERRLFLINELLNEGNYRDIAIPNNAEQQKYLLRALFNIREPKQISEQVLQVQDQYLQYELEKSNIVTLDDIEDYGDGYYIYKGDITLLKVDAIVNAANSKMCGCFIPNHSCIDNCIHTYAGMQLRYSCAQIMDKQGYDEPVGLAKITSGYNLPCKYIIHTVGPMITSKVSDKDCQLLKNCYLSCLNCAKENNINSIAFCCISTGVFHFDNDKAAKIAFDTVKEFKKDNNIKVIFNVFKDIDYQLYKDLLTNHI